MSFTWPWALLALLVLPLLAGIWWWARNRRRRAVVRVTSIALVRAAVPGQSRWRRRIPPALLAAGLIVLAVGAARPEATVPVPSRSATILLALDVSGSMCSTDVTPNRITAAENAASSFIKSEAGGPRIGLIAFAGTAGLLVPPTIDTSKLLSALRGLTTSNGTAIGEAMLTALSAIAQVDPSVVPTGDSPQSAVRGAGYAPDVIVVLTDGANNQGVSPQIAARQAAQRRVRVFTIGFGTTTPAPLVCSNSQFGGGGGFGSAFGGGGFGGGGFGGGFGGHNPLVADYGALRQIAATTGGKFYRAQNADELQHALRQLSGAFTIVHKQVDLAAWFAGGGGLLVSSGVALSLWWNRTRRPLVPAREPAPPAY
jgi:Ca-activated chloride channel homolog